MTESDNVPLNQLYREGLTFRVYPEIKKTFEQLNEFSEKNNFKRSVGNQSYLRGRRYDAAVLYHSIGGEDTFRGTSICELGGRDGIFASWLTSTASEVYVSDYFEEWGKGTQHDLGSLEYWKQKWTESAVDPSRLHCEHQDITNLTYPDNRFDITICTSVIEHMMPQKNWMGDMIGIRELVRITKPGGYILLSTDMTDSNTKWHSGTLYYNYIDLFDRIINPSRCELYGQHDFSFDHPYNTNIHNINGVGNCSSVILTLRKPN